MAADVERVGGSPRLSAPPATLDSAMLAVEADGVISTTEALVDRVPTVAGGVAADIRGLFPLSAAKCASGSWRATAPGARAAESAAGSKTSVDWPSLVSVVDRCEETRGMAAGFTGVADPGTGVRTGDPGGERSALQAPMMLATGESGPDGTRRSDAAPTTCAEGEWNMVQHEMQARARMAKARTGLGASRGRFNSDVLAEDTARPASSPDVLDSVEAVRLRSDSSQGAVTVVSSRIARSSSAAAADAREVAVADSGGRGNMTYTSRFGAHAPQTTCPQTRLPHESRMLPESAT